MTGFEDRIQLLRQRFIERAAADADEIETQAAATNWTAVREVSHSIVGRAGMFGFSELSAAAKVLETAVDEGRTPALLRELSFTLVSDLRAMRAGG